MWNRQVKLNDKVTKQNNFNWQELVAGSQDNNKMDAVVQCQGIFYKFWCSGKDYVETFVYLL